MRLLVLIFLSCAFIPSLVCSQEIVWYTDDKADLHDLFNDKPIAISTDTANLVLKQLPQYKIKFQYAPIPRISSQLTKVENACVANRIKTKERMKENLYSLPLNFYPSYRLYYLKSNIAIPQGLLNEHKQLSSLTELFKILPDAVMAIEKGRSFGPVLDKIIPTIPEKNVFVRSGNEGYSAISNLLFIKRVDFVIAFPTSMNVRIKKANIEHDMLSVEMANIDNYIVGHIACNHSEIGKQFIKDVDEILKRLYDSPAYISAHLRYLNRVDHQAFNNYFELFKKQLLLTH